MGINKPPSCSVHLGLRCFGGYEQPLIEKKRRKNAYAKSHVDLLGLRRATTSKSGAQFEAVDPGLIAKCQVRWIGYGDQSSKV